MRKTVPMVINGVVVPIICGILVISVGSYFQVTEVTVIGIVLALVGVAFGTWLLAKPAWMAIPIDPADIRADRHFYDAFDNSETEISAGWIVRFCQERKQGWKPFTYKQIDAFYASKGVKDGFTFNRLIPSFIVQKGRRYYITPQFVGKCYTASPR